MFQNSAIDVAVGLSLMYLVLSLFCTVVNEFIATRLDLRSRTLAAGLKELLDDPVVRNAFYDHGLISGTQKALANSRLVLTRSAPDATTVATPAPAAPAAVVAAPATAFARAPTAAAVASAVPEAAAPAAPAAAPTAETQPGEHPAYLSAETFALALAGALTGTRLAQGQQTPGFADVKAAIEALPPSKIKSSLQASLMSAQGDFTVFRQSVTTWFDDSMDRLTGAYKGHLRLISILVGCALAVIMNADTFAAGYALWSDSALRGQMAQVAETAMRNGPSVATPEQASSLPPTDVASVYKKTVETLTPLPIGWPMRDWPGAPSWSGTWIWFFVAKFAGWFATGLALSLGAPFWFDLLSKFINLRGTGVKPDRQDSK